jgi:tRNA-specific adenosine deaminase 1
MELTMAAQEDSTPWDLPSVTAPHASDSQDSISTLPPSTDTPILHGRGYFSALGAVRRKPSRPDALATLSKSCSDKLSLKQSTSLLSSITSLLISPQNCYIHSLIIPSSQYSPIACTRAFSSTGRLSPLQGKEWEGGFAFKPFFVATTSKEFKHSRRQVLIEGEKLVPSNIAVSWTPHHNEALIGGTLQGRRQFSLKGASRVCKRRTWRLALEISAMVSVPAIERCLRVDTYRDVKRGSLLESRRKAKEDVRDAALKGWVRNEGGEDWGVEVVDA